MIQLTNISKRYRTDAVETHALRDITLTINAGEFVSIMGPSGCGKSTLLNVLGLLDRPSGGSYQFAGTEVANLKERARTDIRKTHVGFVFQSFNLIDELTVFENVELPLLYQKMPAAERRARVEAALERVGMGHRHGHHPKQLSGGQQQRVAVARAVAPTPQVIFADEPTGNLDSQHGAAIMQLLSDLNAAGTTIVMVTHSETDAAYSGRIVRLHDGQLIDAGLTPSSDGSSEAFDVRIAHPELG
ncbi:MAG: ABC transporter ATP-binding protein [Bacteroidota bacterium]